MSLPLSQFFWKWLKQGHYEPKLLHSHFTIFSEKYCYIFELLYLYTYFGGSKAWTKDTRHWVQALYQLSNQNCLKCLSFSEGLKKGLGSRRACFSGFQKNICEKIAKGIRPILPKWWAEKYLIIASLNLILSERD